MNVNIISEKMARMPLHGSATIILISWPGVFEKMVVPECPMS